MTKYELEALLLEKPIELAHTIAIRSALRAFPAAGVAARKNNDGEKLVLATLRALLSAVGVSRFSDDKNISEAAKRASTAPLLLTKLFSASARSAFSAATSAAKSIFPSEAYYISAVLSSAESAYSTKFSIESVMVAQSFKDMERLEHLPNDRHFDVGLWKTSDFPRVMVSKWDEFGTLASKNNSMWSFWREWYQGFLDGKPMDWELQRRVALIEDDIWKAGPEAVAEEIERIRDKFTLEQEIAALKDKLAKTVEGFDAPHRGHNQPPELIDDARVMQREFTLIWNDLQDLESEVQKDEPSPKAIRKYALRLWEISQTILKYCGSVGDATIKAAAKTIGAALGTALATEAIAPGTVQSVAKMALDYAMKLGAG